MMNFKPYTTDAKTFILLFFPRKRDELSVFSICMCLYFALGIYLLYTTSIIDFPFPLSDIYLGFDNSLIFHHGVTAEFRHPLLVYITMPILYAGNVLFILYPKAKGILFLLGCNALIALSIVYIFRYLKDIICLSKKYIYTIITAYALCNTCVYLSFTTESFTFSIFILSFSLWYFSMRFKNMLGLGYIPVILLTVISGGITITNTGKIILASLFSKDNLRVQAGRIAVSVILIACITLFASIQYDKKKGLPSDNNKTLDNIQTYISMGSKSEGRFLRKMSDKFLGAPILMPQLRTETIVNPRRDMPDVNIQSVQIYMGFYNGHFNVFLLAVFYGIVMYCCWLNRRNRLLWIALSMFIVDFFIHIVIGYAIHEGFIFSGHWVFILPIFIAWGLKKMDRGKAKKVGVVLIGIGAFFLVNNIIRFYDFLQLAQKHYPVFNWW